MLGFLLLLDYFYLNSNEQSVLMDKVLIFDLFLLLDLESLYAKAILVETLQAHGVHGRNYLFSDRYI